MTRPTLKRTRTQVLIAAGVVWAWLTGTFFALPSLSPFMGMVGITIALLYSGGVCLFGKPTIGISSCLTLMITFAYNFATDTDFSVVNYAVAYTITLNFILFGCLGDALRATMPLRRSWLITAGLFGGSLGLGWVSGVFAMTLNAISEM